jgi:hypothetical protein
MVCAAGLCAAAQLAPIGDAAPSFGAHLSGAAPLAGINIPGPGGSMGIVRQIAVARAMHAKLVRTDVPWSTFQPAGPGAIGQGTWASLDRLIDAASAVGIRVIATVDSTPCWASSAPQALLRKCSQGRSSAARAWPPRNSAAYGAFVGQLAARYGSKLAAIEIWNEPDQANQHYLAGPEKPQRYAAILRAAYPAIKHADPGVAVLAGSLVGSDGVFLKALYAAGIKGYYDGLAVHFYNLVLASLRAIHETQLANGDHTPLWLDEFGWTSCWPERRIEQEQGCVTQKVQAANLINTLRALARNQYVAAEVVYKLQDSRAEAFGAISEHGAHKPAFAALARTFRSPFGPTTPVTLHTRIHGGRVVVDGSGPVGDYMQLEVLQGATPRYRAFFTLNRFNDYKIPLPKVLGTRGLTVRVFQYWAGPASAAQRSG